MHLLDANVLIALGWQEHRHHELAQGWFARHARRGWATTAFTQAAFVRILSQPAVAGPTVVMRFITELLARNLEHRGHRLLALDFGFDQVLGCCTGRVVGHRQVADAWLLTAAIRNGARLATFDTGVRALLATDAERDRHLTLLH